MKRRALMALLVGAWPLCTLAQSAAVPSPQQLWREIRSLQKSNTVMPESHPFQAGSRVVDPFTTDLANPLASRTIQRAGGILKAQRYPDGSLVVKENFNQNKKLVGVTAMLKTKKFDLADRNWVMASYGSSGKVLAYGKVGTCIACHVLVRRQDLIFAPPPKQLVRVSTWKAFFPKQAMNPAYVALLREHPRMAVP